MNETSTLKGGRLQQIAIQNKLPTITFTQSVILSFQKHILYDSNYMCSRLVQTCNNSSVYFTEVVLVSVTKPYSNNTV